MAHWSDMRRLGSLVLASILLGVPRALDSGSFGLRRSVYVEVAPSSPELQAFGEALQRALERGCWRLVASRSEATVVVDVLQAVRARRPGVDAMRGADAVTVAVRAGGRVRRLFLHDPSGNPDRSARLLLEQISMRES